MLAILLSSAIVWSVNIEVDDSVESDLAVEQTDVGENNNAAEMTDVTTVNNLLVKVIKSNKTTRNLRAKIFVIFHNIVNGQLKKLVGFNLKEKSGLPGRPDNHPIPYIRPRYEKTDHNAEFEIVKVGKYGLGIKI